MLNIKIDHHPDYINIRVEDLPEELKEHIIKDVLNDMIPFVFNSIVEQFREQKTMQSFMKKFVEIGLKKGALSTFNKGDMMVAKDTFIRKGIVLALKGSEYECLDTDHNDGLPFVKIKAEEQDTEVMVPIFVFNPKA